MTTTRRKRSQSRKTQPASVEMTTFKSWEELGAWYAQLERERRIPDDSVKAEAEELVKGKTDDMAKVRRSTTTYRATFAM